MAFFQDNQSLLKWINQQPLSANINCLGDGHDGVWNIVEQIGTKHQRREILDWYHLRENLHKVGGSNQRLRRAKNYLWQGRKAKLCQSSKTTICANALRR